MTRQRAILFAALWVALVASFGLLSVPTDRYADYPSWNPEDSPCGMTWDNGMALDIEDCDYMGAWNGEGWE